MDIISKLSPQVAQDLLVPQHARIFEVDQAEDAVEGHEADFPLAADLEV